MTLNLLSVVNGLVFDGVGAEPVECPIHTEGGRIVSLEGHTVGDRFRSATSVNAAIVRRPDLGVIREGAAADLVVVDGNPFDRTEVLWTQERPVIQMGKVVER